MCEPENPTRVLFGKIRQGLRSGTVIKIKAKILDNGRRSKSF